MSLRWPAQAQNDSSFSGRQNPRTQIPSPEAGVRRNCGKGLRMQQREQWGLLCLPGLTKAECETSVVLKPHPREEALWHWGRSSTHTLLAEEEKQVGDSAKREKEKKKRIFSFTPVCLGWRCFSTQPMANHHYSSQVHLQPLLKTQDFTWKVVSEHWNMSHFQHQGGHNSNPLLGSALHSWSWAFWSPFRLHNNPSKWLQQEIQFPKGKTELAQRTKSRRVAEPGLQTW